MRQCNRCGEHNNDDAGYCGTCGMSMPTVGSIESLVADGGGAEDDTVVSATTVVQPSAAQHPPSGHPPHDAGFGSRQVPVVRSSRSASVMIAAIAVAAVVIIGGVFILLASGSENADTARTGEDQVAPIDSSGTQAPATAAPVATDSPPIDAPSAETSPVDATTSIAEPASSVTPSTAAPLDSADSTVPPAPSPTGPSRGPGDLGLTQPILDESCDGRYITFVGSAVGDRPYSTVVAELLDRYPGTNYIWTKSCSSLRQEFSNGSDIYGVVFGPYATQREACDAQEFGPDDAYVRRISTSDPQDHTILC